MDLANMEVFIFDLDGTLYEDTHHFHYYANQIKKRLPKNVQPLFEEDYAHILNSSHPLKLGQVYDVHHDLILTEQNNIVVEAVDWHGNALNKEEIKKLFSKPITLDFETMVSIGDMWWVPVAVAAHYGLESDKCYDAFLETRNYMMSPDFQMETIPGLKETLEKMSSAKKLVLLTNSPEQDSEAILQKIGISHVFDKKIFNGMKPVKTVEHFQQVKNDYGVSYEKMVSIGDNWMNEIRPVKALGCSTILLDPYKIKKEHCADIVVKSIKEIIPFLDKIV